MSRILLLSDDPEARKLKAGLAEAGFTVQLIETKAVVSETFAPSRLDLIVADLSHTSVEPAKLCHAIKRDHILKEAPLVGLVTEEGLKRLELAWGIEDFIVWPTTLTQVVSRLKLILWRLDRVELQNGLKVGELSIDFEKYEVYVNGRPQELTYKEFELLKFLATHPGKVLTRELLLNKVWGYDYYGGTRTVDVHIRRLRSKLETGRRVYIDTVRNVGYKFVEPS